MATPQKIPFAQRTTLTGILLSVLALLVYMLTVSPSVGYEDRGELAATVYTLGIPHPTGYPLFTLLGRAFLFLPWGGNVIGKLNLFGAVLCSLSVFLFFRLFRFFLSEKASVLFRGKPVKADTIPSLAAAGAVLAFAFSKTYWTEAISIEVYALHLVFLSLITGLFLLTMSDQIRTPGRLSRPLWILFAYVLGLSFTHHMMTVLLAPAFLYLFFSVHGFKRPAWIRILIAIPPFILGLLLYLYLPIRAATNPVMNWGDPSTLESFWRHVTAAQFRFKMFSSTEIAWSKLKEFVALLPSEFGYLPLIISAIGLWALYRSTRRLLIFSVLIFVGCVFYAINYAFNDPNFYLNAYFAMSVWMAFGIHWLLKTVQGGWKFPVRLLCCLVALSPLLQNYKMMNQSRDYSVEDYTMNVLNSMDRDGVFFTNEYWLTSSPAYYLQLVERVRPDIAVVDVGLLGGSWYYDQLEMRYPSLIQDSKKEIEAFRTELAKERRGEVDLEAYNNRMREMFLAMVRNSRLRGKPVYVSLGINMAEAQGYVRVPSGMVFRLLSDSEPVTLPTPRDFRFRQLPPESTDPRVKRIRMEYAEGYANQGSYQVAYGDTTIAISLLRKAVTVLPDFPEAAGLLATIEAIQRTDVKD